MLCYHVRPHEIQWIYALIFRAEKQGNVMKTLDIYLK